MAEVRLAERSGNWAQYNVAGQQVRKLVDGTKEPGAHAITWDGRSDAGNPVSSGVYFYKLVTNNFMETKKMILLK